MSSPETDDILFDPFNEINDDWDHFMEDPKYYPETENFGYISGDEFNCVHPISSPALETFKKEYNEYDSIVDVPSNIARTMQPEDPTQLFEDRSEFIPNKIAVPKDEGIFFFPDSAFAKSFLCSIQNVKHPKNLSGFIIIPAKYVTRLRSGPSNHKELTKCLYVPTTIGWTIPEFE